MYKAKHLLDKNCLKNIYFSFIHSYLNYCNIAWASSYQTQLKKLHIVQKKACRIILNKHRHYESKPLMMQLGVLNIYQLNKFQISFFMYRLTKSMLPDIFQPLFTKINHRYHTRHSYNNFTVPRTVLYKTDFAISCRGSRLWKTVSNEAKNITSVSTFKKCLKRQLLTSPNDFDFNKL